MHRATLSTLYTVRTVARRTATGDLPLPTALSGCSLAARQSPVRCLLSTASLECKRVGQQCLNIYPSRPVGPALYSVVHYSTLVACQTYPPTATNNKRTATGSSTDFERRGSVLDDSLPMKQQQQAAICRLIDWYCRWPTVLQEGSR